MSEPQTLTTIETGASRWRGRLSLAMWVLAGLVLVGTFFLISPPPAPSYPGAIPWSPHSWLKVLTDAMSLFGLLQSARGVEVKDSVLHWAAAVGLVLLALRGMVSGLLPPARRSPRGAWLSAEWLLLAWVVVSAASMLWSGDARLSFGQAALFGFVVAWAIAVSWTLESRDVPRVLWTYVAVAAAGAGLCLWYYYERNPYHRPGFPIGNPSALAASIVPAALIALFVACGSVWGLLRRRRDVSVVSLPAALVVLVPLGWCLWLTASRGAMVGAVLGVAGVLFIVMTRRMRMVIISMLIVLAAGGAWYLSHSMQDQTMARGATVRFRIYTWKYAAELWGRRPVSGMGAGCFPRAVGSMAVEDRVLDPAAFMGDKIAHVHNEFFEVFAEIGLVGGLTFVGAFVATLVAAGGLLQSNFSRRRYLLMLGLVAGVAAMLGDSLFGVNLRLPGAPAVFYTLLGTLWAACRSVSRDRTAPREAVRRERRSQWYRFGVASLATLGAIVAVWLAWRDDRGMQREFEAMNAMQEHRFDDCIRASQIAAARLLDPIRILLSRERAVVAHGYIASNAYYTAQLPADSSPDADLVQSAIDAAKTAYRHALAFHKQAPGFGYAAGIAGQAAGFVADLLLPRNAAAAARWQRRSWQSWMAQRSLTPYDRTALLALVRFPMLIGDQVGLLRDALRAGSPDQAWLDALNQAAQHPRFAVTLNAMVLAATPYTPESDAGALIWSGAPEIFRLRGIWLHNEGRSIEAVADAEHAVELYRPLKSRFPTLPSVALAEQAEYTFFAYPREPARAIALAREALDLLPRIQPQQYDKMAAPWRLRLARYLLAAGELDALPPLLDALYGHDEPARQAFVVETYHELIGRFGALPRDRRPNLDAWVNALLALRPDDPDGWWWKCWLAAERNAQAACDAFEQARAAGLPLVVLEGIRTDLCVAFPDVCELLGRVRPAEEATEDVTAALPTDRPARPRLRRTVCAPSVIRANAGIHTPARSATKAGRQRRLRLALARRSVRVASMSELVRMPTNAGRPSTTGRLWTWFSTMRLAASARVASGSIVAMTGDRTSAAVMRST